MEGYLTIEEAARFLRYSRGRLRILAHEKKIPAYRRGRRWFFKRDELETHYAKKFEKSIN